jgi:triosephosphate isomerase (TIM)
MYKTVPEAKELVTGLIAQHDDVVPVEVVVCPPATALYSVKELIRAEGSKIGIGAQDIFGDSVGAFTGMLSAPMLLDCGCTYVIVGHSERRGRFGKLEGWMTPAILALFGDTCASVNAKAKVAQKAGLTPIVCCGETIDERRAGKTDEIIAAQIKAATEGLDLKKLVIAYEPVWAIGTGETCDAAEAQRVCKLIRSVVAEACPDAAEALRIQYGGSVKPDNAEELLGQPDIDGALVGGASLEVDKFAAIVRAAKETS